MKLPSPEYWDETLDDVLIDGDTPCVTTGSYLTCKRGGMITPQNDGQDLSDEAQLRLILQAEIRDEIYNRFPDTPEGKTQAKNIIAGLGINDEKDPYTLLSWKEMLIDEATRESLQEEVGNGVYAALGITNPSLFDALPEGTEINQDEYPFDYARQENGAAANNLSHQHPIPGKTITTGIGGYPGHVGVDYATQGQIGFQINATTAGEVVTVADSTGGYGSYVKIKDNEGNFHIYGHMSDNSYVSTGDFILPGQKIGDSGNTGNVSGATGPYYGAHLHYEVQSSGSVEDNKNPYIPAENGNPAAPGYRDPIEFGG